MKKLRISILLSCIIISGCANEKIEMDIITSNNTTADNWYELDLSVIVDKDIVSDKKACSEEIIQHILANDFHSSRFSFDISGYPNEVTVDVYTSEKNIQNNIKEYSFSYITKFNTQNVGKQNNIKDNPEEYEIQYK